MKIAITLGVLAVAFVVIVFIAAILKVASRADDEAEKLFLQSRYEKL